LGFSICFLFDRLVASWLFSGCVVNHVPLCLLMFFIVIAMDYSLQFHRFGYHPMPQRSMRKDGFGGLW
jgi:hypothetical protein